jgi:hypothetical protein
MLKQKQKIFILGVMSLIILGGFFVFFKESALAATGINKQVNFQGKVVNTDGTNVANNSYSFTFKIYSQQAPGGVAIWTETKSLTISDGIFQTNLGDTVSLPGSVDFNTDSIFLGIEFNGNGEMTPRVQFTASPYAFNSDALDGKDWTNPGTIGTSATTLALASGGTSAWTNTSGNLTISTATSGTLALTSVGALNLSAGSASTVALANTTNALNFDTNTLSIDALNNRIGIGTNGPTAFLDVTAPTTGAASLRLEASAGVNPSAPNIGDLWFNGINLYFRKDGSTSQDILASSGGGYATIQEDGVSVTQRSTINFIGGDITCVDNLGNTRTDCTITGGVEVHDVTYSDLTTLIAGNALVPGDKYRLTDFRTRHTIPETSTIHTGATEVLILTANSINTLDMLAVSESYPQDVIYYTVRNDWFYVNDPVLTVIVDPAFDRGTITYRKDTERNVEVHEDFRNTVFRKWEDTLGSGLYISWMDNGNGYQDFPMFANYNATSEVHIDHHRGNGSGATDGNYLSDINFRGSVYKVEFLDGAEHATFLGNVTELSMKFCSKGVFYGDIERAVFGTSSETTVTGTLYQTYINKSEIFLDGNFSNVEVLANYTGTSITGNHTDEVFGASSQTIAHTLTPANDAAVGGNKDNPYILGTNNEDTLIIDSVNLTGSAFILIDTTTPQKEIKITGGNGAYVAFDGIVGFNMNAWTLVNFNNLEGIRIEGGKVLTMDGTTGSWTTQAATSITVTNISWDGGADSNDGFENRYSLNGAQYAGLSGASFDGATNLTNFSNGLRLNVANTDIDYTSYGEYIDNLATNTAMNGINKYGLYINSTGNFTGDVGAATNNYGLYVDTPTGADNNYAAVFGGNVGIGTVSPTASLDITAPTTTSASLRLEASAAIDPATPNIGDLWFNGSNLYFRKDGTTSVDLLASGSSQIVHTLTPANDAAVGGNKDNPYILGTNNEDTLIIDSVNLTGSAFILIDTTTPQKEIKITGGNGAYVAFDGIVGFNMNAWTLVNFNNLEGIRIEGGKVLTMDGTTGSWTTESVSAVYVTNVSWEGGSDTQDGYESRFTLDYNQYLNLTGEGDLRRSWDISGTNPLDIYYSTGNVDVGAGLTVSAGDLAVNSDSITSDGATLTINAGGTVDVQDILQADSITVDTGNVSIANGQSYTGEGAVTVSSATASGLTLESGTTGAITIGGDSSAETITIGTGAAAKTIAIGSTNTTSTTTLQSGSGGINLKANNGSTGDVQIGTGGTGTATPDLFKLDVRDAGTAGDPTGADGAMYYSKNTNKFRCYQNGAWTDCLSTGGGDSISVNGTAATNANFSDTTPTVVNGTANVKWQKNTAAPDDISAYFDFADFNTAFKKKPTFASDFHGGSGAAYYNLPFLGAAVSSGTINSATAGAINGDHPGIVRLISSTTANGGYRFQTANGALTSAPSNIRLKGGEVFNGVVYHNNLATTTVRLGFHDSITSADAVDGCYFEIPTTGAAVGKCSNNSTRTTTAGSYTISINTWYSYRITLNSDATLATFEIFNSAGTALFTSNNTVNANIPKTSGRETGVGIVATESSTTATDMVNLDYMSYSMGSTNALAR